MAICTAMTFPVLIIEYIILMIAAICDVKCRKIYNGIIICLLFNSLFSPFNIMQRMAAFFIPLIFITPLAMRFSSIKGGDIKFVCAVGAFFGIYKLSVILITSIVIGVIYCLIKKEKSFPLAFIMFISVLLIKFSEVFLL